MQDGNSSNMMILSMFLCFEQFWGMLPAEKWAYCKQKWTQLPNSYKEPTHLQERIFIRLTAWKETFDSSSGLISAEDR